MQDAENLFSVRRINVGGMQGHGDPVLSRYREPESGPGLAGSRVAYIAGALCLALWLAVCVLAWRFA